MELKPFDWNIVIVGSWNRAILTPVGIYKILFNRPNEKKFNIAVPMDSDEPYKVRYQGLEVTAYPERLVIRAEEPILKNLERAARAGSRALSKLPQTPYLAAGINLKYRVEKIGKKSLGTTSPLDKRLAERQFKMLGQSTSRALSFKDGRLNMVVTENPAEDPEITFNFERKSGDGKALRNWLLSDLGLMEITANRILKEILGLA